MNKSFYRIMQPISLIVSSIFGWFFLCLAVASVGSFLICLFSGGNLKFHLCNYYIFGLVALLSVFSFFNFQNTNFSKKQKLILVSFSILFLIYFIFSFFEVESQSAYLEHLVGLFNASQKLGVFLFIIWYVFHASFLLLYFKNQ